jgi:predicted RNase H-like nuclease (RuvC/YqgF family)
LEYQYEQAFNELKMHREGGFNGEIENQMNAYMEEIESYKEKLNSLHGENVELQKMLEEYEGENDHLKQEKYQTNVDRSKVEELIRQVEQKEHEIHSLQEEYKTRSAPQVNIQQY